MGNVREWGMGIKRKSPSFSLSLKISPFSLLSTPYFPLPTPHLQKTIKRQGAVTVDLLATNFEGGKQGWFKVVGTVLCC